jgi:hypothetical protein
MFRFTLGLIRILVILLLSYSSYAQEVEAPVYRDGDWWRVKVEVARPAGVSVGGPQALESFPEYVVKIETGKPKVFGVRENETKEIDSLPIISLVLGKPGWLGQLLKFPMRVGLTWTDRFQFQPIGAQIRWEEGRYEVQAWERIKTLKGDFDAFKILMHMTAPTGATGKGTEVRTRTYYYAPDIKAIASVHTSGTASVASTLIDFSLAK